MTAHKLRHPGSLADALTRILGDMTAEDAAAAVGKSASLVRKWSDPDVDCWPNVLQSLALDVAYAEAGHGAGPIGFWMRELYRESVSPDAEHSAECPQVRTLRVAKEVGDVSDAVLSLRDRRTLSRNELAAALREIREATEELSALARDLEAKTPAAGRETAA